MALPLIVMLLFALASRGEAAQSIFETSLTGARRATSSGEARKALEYFERQAADFEDGAKADRSSLIYVEMASRAYREASNAAFFLGNFQKAVDHGEKAFALASEIANPILKLTALSSLHQANRDLKNVARARELIGLGLKLAQEFSLGSMNRTWWEAVFYAYRSSDFRARREYQKAIEDAERALRLYEDYLSKMPDSGRRSEARKETAITNMVLIYARLGRTYFAMGRTDHALKHYQRGLGLAQSGNKAFSQVSLFQGMGDVYDREGEYTKALDHFNKAFDLARQQQRVDAISDAARRMGDVYRKTGKKSEAIASYRIAVEQIESIRALLGSERNRQAYFAGGLAAYNGLVETLWEGSRYSEAFHYGERIRSRTFLDMLGTKVRLSRSDSAMADEERALTELNEKGESEAAYRAFLKKVRSANPEQASLMSVQPLSLNQVQNLLLPSQMLLEYLVTPEKIYLWAVERKRLDAYTIPLGRKTLIAKIDSLRSAISSVSSIADYQRIARDLHEHLIGPIGSRLRGKDLVVVPHDALHYLPFHALYSPEGKYLVEDHAISYLSSASLLSFVSGKPRDGLKKILAIGNPQTNGEHDNLPLAELEVAEIKNYFPSSVVLLKDEASEAKIKQLSPGYDILHFAGHAELSEKEPLKSAILLRDSGGEDGRLEVREIFALNLKARLVVLSGCETGLGALSKGDEFVGLTRAFLYAGTPSVVASLWKVDDASTAHIMNGFYSNLKSKNKVEALREAQLRMIRGDMNSDLLARRGIGGVGKLGAVPDAQFSAHDSVSIATAHPYFWAPFILVGDGR